MNVMEGYGQVSDANNNGCSIAASASGDCSVAVGSNSQATELNSVAIGQSSIAEGVGSAAFGKQSHATGLSSTAIGSGYASGMSSVAVGIGAQSFGANSLTFGDRLYAYQTGGLAIGRLVKSDAPFAYIFGHSYVETGVPHFTNDIANSMMFGMNSTVSTMFIGSSSGEDTWGNIGIGNITAPASLLHVRDQMRVGLTGSANGSLVFNNSGGNTITFNTPAALTSHDYTWPNAQATTTGQVLVNDGTGILSWAAPGSTSGSWLVDGNSGTNPSANFLGTLDNVDLVLRTDDTERMRVMAGGNVGIGINNPAFLLDVFGHANLRPAHRYHIGGLQALGLPGPDNVAVGHLAGFNVPTGDDNTFVGTESGYSTTSGSDNTFVGNMSGRSNTTGATNVFIGHQAGYSNVNGGTSTFVGTLAGFSATGSNNSFLGYQAGQFTNTGIQNTLIGTRSGRFNTSGHDNTFLGHRSGYDNDSGYRNTFIGMDAGNKNTDGYDNTCLGYNTGFPVGITLTNATAIGANTTATVSNTVILGNGADVGIGTTTPSGKLHVNGTVFINYASVPPVSDPNNLLSNEQDLGINSTNGQLINLSTSSIHFKDNVEDLEFEREAFLNLRPVNFNWKEYYGGGQDVGLIAQEVNETFPALASWSHKYTHLDNGDLLRDSLGNPVVDTTQMEVSGVRYHKLPVYLLAIVKEQQQRIDALQEQFEGLSSLVSDCCGRPDGAMHRLGEGTEKDEVTVRAEVATIQDMPILSQNAPNPFHESTVIRFYLPKGTKDAFIRVTDTSGTVVRLFSLNGFGTGSITFEANSMAPSNYTYSLVVDRQMVDTKTMVITR